LYNGRFRCRFRSRFGNYRSRNFLYRNWLRVRNCNRRLRFWSRRLWNYLWSRLWFYWSGFRHRFNGWRFGFG
jgi:hypothetical protein